MTQDHLFNAIIEQLHHGEITGWCEEEKALDLAAIVLALRPKTIVELGVWGGRSLIPMAMACKWINHGTVIGIDPWSPQASQEGYDAVNAEWWAAQDHQQVFEGFIGHLRRLGLNNFVTVQRMKSDECQVPMVVDFLHVDGQHCAQAIKDVKRFAPAVRIGGIVCMDDLEWTTDGVGHVKLAVTELLNLGFIELYRTKTEKGSWGFFQRTTMPVVKAKRKRRPC